MEEKIVYFETPGEDNTEAVLALVKERAEARDIRRIVLASTRGYTARLAAKAFVSCLSQSGLKFLCLIV